MGGGNGAVVGKKVDEVGGMGNASWVLQLFGQIRVSKLFLLGRRRVGLSSYVES